MLASSLVSLTLLALSGVLFDSHRREWRGVRANGTGGFESRFAGSRFRRRSVATACIAVVGTLVALWPVIPREPSWVLGYAAALASLAMLIFTLGVCDAWASGRHYREVSRRSLAAHTDRLRELVERPARETTDERSEAADA